MKKGYFYLFQLCESNIIFSYTYVPSTECARWIVDIKKPTVASFLVIIYSFFHHKIGKKKYQVSPKTVRGHNSSFKKFLQSIVNTLYQAQCWRYINFRKKCTILRSPKFLIFFKFWKKNLRSSGGKNEWIG